MFSKKRIGDGGAKGLPVGKRPRQVCVMWAYDWFKCTLWHNYLPDPKGILEFELDKCNVRKAV